MKRAHINHLILGLIGVLIGRLIGLSWWETLAVSSFLVYARYFVGLIGKKVIVFELTVFLALLTWLVMPVLFYHIFTEEYRLAFIWDKFMRVSSDEYFAFALPATWLMALGIHAPLFSHQALVDPKDIFTEIRSFLSNKTVIGVLLIAIGLMTTLISPYIPASLAFVFYLLAHLSFVGFLYLYFSKVPFRSTWLIIGALALLFQSISSAMFGELIYIGFLSVALLLSTTQLASWKKWMGLAAGLFGILLIQSVKHEYRAVAWSQGANPIFFAQAVGQKLNNPADLVEPTTMFNTAVRMNQGWLIAKTMYHVPRHKPYGNGSTIMSSLAASFVPRFLWPNKPEAGGKANLKRFWGMELTGYSMNIGVIGESYANFGVRGGIIFMLFYGLVLNLFLSLIIRLVKVYPTILLWFPILFLYPVGTETDLLSTINPLIKITAFIMVLYLTMPYILRVRLG